jgi:catalase
LVKNLVKIKAFADADSEVLLQGKHFTRRSVLASFAAVSDSGVHAFGLVDPKGNKQCGKWIFEPVAGVEGLSDDGAKAKAKRPTFLFDDVRQRVTNDKAAFNLTLNWPNRAKGWTVPRYRSL